MSLEVLTAWRKLLGELGQLGGALREAIQRGDVLAAIAANIQLRKTRAAIARVEAPARLHGQRDELAVMEQVSALTIDARTAEAAMKLWLGRQVPGDARLLSSPLGIAVLADMILPEVWDFEADLVVFIGAGLEPVAQVLADLGQRRLVIVSGAGSGGPPEAFTVDTNEEAALALRTMVPGPPSRMVVRASLGVDPVQRDELVQLLRDVQSDQRIHRNTVRAFSRTWVEQGLANLQPLMRWPSIAALGDRFVGVPMVIAAPGPSLAKNVEQLRGLAGRAIVTAFSHSLKPVLAAGVTPDLVLTVDPQDVRYHFADCDLSRTCLVNAATVHPSLFELPAQRFLTLSANSAIDDWIFDGLGESAIVPGGGSVATSAFSLALAWGCDPIVFVGLDLSFPGGNYYVSTSADGDAKAVVDDRGLMRVAGWSPEFHAMKAAGGPNTPHERCIELPGWSGGTVPSSFMFSMFHRWFVDQLRAIDRAGGGVTVYNCTEGGAFIDGMQHLPLADVIAGFTRTVDITDALDGAAMTQSAARGQALIDHLDGFHRGVRKSRRLVAVARRLIKRGNVGPRLAAVERGLADAMQPLTFASLLAQREIDRAHDVARHEGSEGDYLDASAALFATIANVLDQLEPALGGALARLGTRRNRGRAA